MKKAVLRLVCVLAVLLVVCCIVLLVDAELRVKCFVLLHGQEIITSYQTYGSVPAGVGYKYFNVWEGSHTMLEFLLFSRGDTYFGCYYSFNDVPLAFQNFETELVEKDGGWSWYTEGDNHGFTQRLAPNWYYFEASF